MINPKLLDIMMSVGQRKEKYMYKCKYFGIKELVSKIVYDFYAPKYSENFIWKFFDEDILRDLDLIRKYHGKSITINNWQWGGDLHQCGLRCNIDPIVKAKNTPYLGGHNLAIGFDGHSEDNVKLFNDIQYLIKSGQLKKIRRLESRNSTKDGWVHFDGLRTTNDGIEIFMA